MTTGQFGQKTTLNAMLDLDPVSDVRTIADGFDLDQFKLHPAVIHAVNQVRFDVLMLTSQKPQDRHSHPALEEVPNDEINSFRVHTADMVRTKLACYLLPDNRPRIEEKGNGVTVYRTSNESSDHELHKALGLVMLIGNKEIQDRLSGIKGSKTDVQVIEDILPIVSPATIEVLRKNPRLQKSVLARLKYDMKAYIKLYGEEFNFQRFIYRENIDYMTLASSETIKMAQVEYDKIIAKGNQKKGK